MRGPFRTWMPAREGCAEILGRRSGGVVVVGVGVGAGREDVVEIGIEREGRMEGRWGVRVKNVLR